MSQQPNALDHIVRSIIPSATRNSSWLSIAGLVFGFFLCFCGLLTLVSLFLMGCWNGFVSPILGLRHMDFNNAVWFTASLLVAVSFIAILKEAKEK